MNIDRNTAAGILMAAEGMIPKRVRPAPTSPNYPVFLENTRASEDELANERRFYDAHKSELPLVSILLYAAGESETDINSTVISLVAQTYGGWELIIGVDLAYANADKFGGSENIKLIMCADRAMKWMQAEARGEYIMLLRVGDRLSPDALFKLTSAVKGSKMAYADSDVCDEKGNRIHPRFKPSFSPVSELCFETIDRPLLVEKSLHWRVGGLYGADASSYRDYTVKCCRRANNAAHVPKVLLSQKPSSAAEVKDVPVWGYGLTVCGGMFEGSLRICSATARSSTVDIIISDPASAAELRRCIEAIDVISVDGRHSIIISVCGEKDADLVRYLDALRNNDAAKIVWDKNRPSSPPAAFNLGASHSFAEHLVFIAPEAEPVTPEFIDELLIPLRIDGVGICGGKLVDKDGLLVHTGTVIGINGWAAPLYTGAEDDMEDETKCFYTSMQRNVSAVSGAFMAVSAEDFCRIGMFDDTLDIVGWDTEFCLRAAKKGLQTVYTPFAKAKYHGKLSRFDDAPRSAKVRCYDVLRSVLLEGDPFYSPNYDCRRDVPQLAIEPVKPIKLNPLF